MGASQALFSVKTWASSYNDLTNPNSAIFRASTEYSHPRFLYAHSCSPCVLRDVSDPLVPPVDGIHLKQVRLLPLTELCKF